MKIKKTKNKYGHDRISCPFCDEDFHLSNGRPIANLQRHIRNQAKNEALAVLCGDVAEQPNEVKHLTYYKAHTSKKQVVITDDRKFDDDLEIA